MVQWTLLQALMFGLVASVSSIAFMLVITYLDNKGKTNENVGQSRNRNK
jgi:predicted Kef-type K+ transport protein